MTKPKREGNQQRCALVDVMLARAWSEDDQCFYAWSPQLKCVRDGETEQAAVNLCKEALEILFESLIERGTLLEFLVSRGYTSEVFWDHVRFEQVEVYRLPQRIQRSKLKERRIDLPRPSAISKEQIPLSTR